MKLSGVRAQAPQQLVVVVVAFVALCCAFGSAGQASAAPSATRQAVPEGLSIAITDGVAETAPGASATYTATVTNRGTMPVTGELVIALADRAGFTSVQGAQVDKREASWRVTVAPGTSTSRRAAARVGRIPHGEVRVTTLATLYANGDRSVILVRAADADAIRGVVDPAHTVGEVAARVPAAPAPPWALLGVAVAAVLAASATAGVALTRRRRRRAHPRRAEAGRGSATTDGQRQEVTGG